MAWKRCTVRGKERKDKYLMSSKASPSATRLDHNSKRRFVCSLMSLKVPVSHINMELNMEGRPPLLFTMGKTLRTYDALRATGTAGTMSIR